MVRLTNTNSCHGINNEDCRGVLPGDDTGFTVRTFPQTPRVITNILKHAQIWVERARGVAVLLQWESVAGTMQTLGGIP